MSIKFAQLPGLKKAKQILELSERIQFHKEKATICLNIFNRYTQKGLAAQADTFQERCEWHMSQASQLAIELKLLEGSR